jgi:hypothetical protein
MGWMLIGPSAQSVEVLVMSDDARAIHSAALGASQASAIAGYVGGFACVLNFGDVPPGIGLAAVEIGEAVDLRQLPAGQRLSVPARHVGILCERRDGAADERWTLRNSEVGRARGRVTPVRFSDAIRLEHGLGS